jgi:hypothetical protein
VFFDDLRIPASALVGEEGKGFRYILSGMNAERILIAAEGLSSLAQERAMKLMGCRLGQGTGSYQSLSTNTLNTILCKDPEQLGQAVVQPWRSSPDSGAVAV